MKRKLMIQDFDNLPKEIQQELIAVMVAGMFYGALAMWFGLRILPGLLH